MIDDLRLAAIGAFVATGLTLLSFVVLGLLCAMTLWHGAGGERIPLIFVIGTGAGLSLFYARYEYRNLRELKAESEA